MDINSRIELIISDLYGNRKSAFAKTIGVSPTVVENIVGKRRTAPSFMVMEKICANANIDGNWLILGEGERLKTADLPHCGMVQVAHGDNNNQNIANADTLLREVEFLKQRITDREKSLAEKDEEIKFLRGLVTNNQNK